MHSTNGDAPKTCSTVTPHLERLEQAHGDLHAPALAVADAVHAPLRVNVKHLHQLGAAHGVAAGRGAQHLQRGEVALQSDDEQPCVNDVPNGFKVP